MAHEFGEHTTSFVAEKLGAVADPFIKVIETVGALASSVKEAASPAADALSLTFRAARAAVAAAVTRNTHE